MADLSSRYFGTYMRLESTSENLEVIPAGDRVSVGQPIKYEASEYVTERGKDAVRVSISNLIGDPLGFMPEREAKQIFEFDRAGWDITVTVSAVGYTESISNYWIELAVMAYDPTYKEGFEPLIKSQLKRVAKGERPMMDLTPKTIDRILMDGVDAVEIKRTSYAKLPKGQAYYKRHATKGELMAISASGEKRGAWTAASVAILVVVAAAVIFGIYKLIS